MNNQTPPATARAALRDAIRRAVCEAEGFGYAWGTDMLEPDEYGEVADAVLAVLPAPDDQAAEIERLRTENTRMRHELEVMYGGAFDRADQTTPRAAVLREAAEVGRELSRQGYSAQEIARKLDRMADEAQPEPVAVRDAREALYAAEAQPAQPQTGEAAS
jgi:hypothetical protein